jgi:hypothetical protein
MTIHAKPPPGGGRDGGSETSSLLANVSKPPNSTQAQITNRNADSAEAGFDADIALDLADYIVIAVERANNSSKGTRFTNSSKKHGPPPRHGSGPRRFEISS